MQQYNPNARYRFYPFTLRICLSSEDLNRFSLLHLLRQREEDLSVCRSIDIAKGRTARRIPLIDKVEPVLINETVRSHLTRR